MDSENLNNTNIEQKNDNKDTKRNVIIALLILIILLLLLTIGILIFNFGYCNRPIASTPDIGGVGLVIDENAGEYVEPEKPAPAQGVAVPGWGSIVVPANTTEITVDFFNPEENKDLYYLTFELRLIDENTGNQETLYTSGLVEPGLHIQKITLSRPLEAGEYDAIIHVQPYRMDEARTPTNNADMETKIIVK